MENLKIEESIKDYLKNNLQVKIEKFGGCLEIKIYLEYELISEDLTSF